MKFVARPTEGKAMTGRWKQWMCAGVLVGAVGCGSSRQSVTMPEATLPTSQNQTSALSRVFGSDKFVPQTPKAEQPVASRPTKKPGQGLEPATEVGLAEAEVDAAFMEGRTDVERDQLLDSARQRYQRALKSDPKHKDAMVGLAQLYAIAGDRDRAIRSYQTALHANPKDHELAYRMAKTCAGFEDWQGCAEAAKYALTLDPENRAYRKSLGLAQARMGQFQEAFDTLLEARLNEAQARYILGRTLMDMNRVEEGMQQIRTAVQQDPQYAIAQQFLADYQAGRITSQDPLTVVGHQESGR